MQQTWVQSLGWEDPLEKEMATHTSILAWEIPQTEVSGGLQSMGWQRVGHDLATKQQQTRFWMVLASNSLYHCAPALHHDKANIQCTQL